MTSSTMNQKELNAFKDHYRRFLYGQSNGYQLLDALQSIPNLSKKIAQKGLLETRKHPNLTSKQQMQINAHRYAEVFRLAKQSKNPEAVFRNPDYLIELYGLQLNTGAFLTTIELLGDSKQVQRWRQLVLSGKVIGGYGQTQLGHGSNVQMLETQALYDQEKDVFIINTPKNTAAKYWPGCFGIFSTHCVLQAKTIVKGQNIGIQTFILPMRDTYLNALTGIEAGDIGPKIGFIKVDNGYLKINNVEITRQHMLSKYIQVEGNGNVIGLQNKQAIKYGYGSMLNLRVQLVIAFSLAYTYGPTIVQYQIAQKTGQINDALIKKKLIQNICRATGTLISNIYVFKLFKRFLASLEKKDFNNADKLLVSCHIISSTFKALSSWKGEQITRQMVTLNQGGSFQSTYLPKYLADSIPSVTYEGDNTVLLQQTAKFILIKEKQDQLLKPNAQVDSNDLSQLLAVFKFVASSQIRNLKSLIQKSVESGTDFKVVWNQIYQIQIIQVSKVWGRMTFLYTAMQTLKTIKQYRNFFEKIIKVYASTLVQETKQIKFYGFKISQFTGWQQFTSDQIQVLRDLNRPVRRQYEPHHYESRGSKEVSDWIYSKL